MTGLCYVNTRCFSGVRRLGGEARMQGHAAITCALKRSSVGLGATTACHVCELSCAAPSDKGQAQQWLPIPVLQYYRTCPAAIMQVAKPKQMKVPARKPSMTSFMRELRCLAWPAGWVTDQHGAWSRLSAYAHMLGDR